MSVEVGVVASSHPQGSIMDVKQAVRTAKEHVVELFADEPIGNAGLEEVEFDDLDKVWAITIGFSRLWDDRSDDNVIVRALSSERDFKIVRIEDETGRVQSLKHRHVSGDR